MQVQDPVPTISPRRGTGGSPVLSPRQSPKSPRSREAANGPLAGAPVAFGDDLGPAQRAGASVTTPPPAPESTLRLLFKSNSKL